MDKDKGPSWGRGRTSTSKPAASRRPGEGDRRPQDSGEQSSSSSTPRMGWAQPSTSSGRGSTGDPRGPAPSQVHGRASVYKTETGGGSAAPSGNGNGMKRQRSTENLSSSSKLHADSTRGDAVRGALRGRRTINVDIVQTRPKNVHSKKGSTGDNVMLQTNYFRLVRKPDWNLYQYRVDFEPEVTYGKRIIFENKRVFGGYLFDGTLLYTTKKFDQEMFEFAAQSREGTAIKVTLRFVGVVSTKTDAASIQVLNLILRRAMEGLKLQLVGRNFYDARAKINVENHPVQLWPGYLTSIKQHEQDMLLCTEIIHKTMRTETVYSIMRRIQEVDRDFRRSFLSQVIGMTVLTDYNNKTYRVDDVDFDRSPRDTFETRKGTISFLDYYKNNYKITIRDVNQPLLLSRARQRDLRGGGPEFMALIPELCRATGITDAMRNDFKLTRAMSDKTRLRPDTRIERLLKFNNRLNETPESMAVFNEWSFKLDKSLVQVPGRVLQNEKIVFGNGSKVITNFKVDWQNEFRNNQMYSIVSLERWAIITPGRSRNVINDFLRSILTVSRTMAFNISPPRFYEIQDDRQNTYTNAIDQAASIDPQMILCLVPNNNSDRYSSIKRKCCNDRAIPTQVVVQRTITPKPGKGPGSLMSIATKVAIQMNCKLGGAAWSIEVPLEGVMTIGFDVCHDTRDRSRSYGALVATMDLRKCAKYFSAVSAHTNGEEFDNELALNVTKALKEYRNTHNALPKKICFYRDGVGEGQTRQVYEHEIINLKKRLDEIYQTAGADTMRLAFIVVSKRINTRFFLNKENPPAGLVVDDIVTMPERYDFFLVSPYVTQGTVSPTNYNVLHDNMGLPPDRLQIFTYKNCHLYYNYSGTTRVPSVCQYAHKLAFLVSQYLHTAPLHLLENQLYFL